MVAIIFLIKWTLCLKMFFLNKIIVFSLSLSFKKTKYLSAAATVYYTVNLSASNIIFNIANIMSKNAFSYFF